MLEETRTREQRLRDLPLRAGVYFVLALGLFPGLGYQNVRAKLTAARDGLELPCPSVKALRDLQRRIGAAPVKALFEVLAGPVAQPSAPGGAVRPVPDGGLRRLRLGQGAGQQAEPGLAGEAKAALGVTGYPAIELMTLAETGTR